jgi:hypothetical protein
VTANLLKTAAVLFAQAGCTEDDALDQFDTIANIVGTALTSLALLVAGVWAYSKFVKGRTFRPRIKLELGGQWHVIDGRYLLQVHLTITNIGASKVVLLQEGTALILKKPSSGQAAPPAMLTWDDGEVFEIFLDHDWIEPSEIVSDDLLIHLGEGQPISTLLDVRTIWKRKLFKNIDVSGLFTIQGVVGA